MFYINKLMKMVLSNKESIDGVYTFDKVCNNEVFGVEIRLKKGVDHILLDSEDLEYLHINPFTSAKGYLYLAVGNEGDFKKFVKDGIEGIVCQKLIKEFPQILEGGMWTTEHRDEIDKRKKEIELEVRDRYEEILM